ncbi:hypothetical protein [Lentzea alba]|uniref:hypothetical protein n=1 Tax=Lentzea alba TaxID=2714351 RepID=UPI001F5F35C2|nr:hypothetical protein [Lentzea alba]
MWRHQRAERGVVTRSGGDEQIAHAATVDGRTSDEVCTMLEISPANQRVLLHRGRATVRAHLETYFATAGETA